MERLASMPDELVIYDVPPLDTGTIALGLAARTDATLLVTRLQKTPRSALRDACSLLGLVNAKVIGLAVQGLRSIPPAPEPSAVRQGIAEMDTPPAVAYGAQPRAG